MRLIFAAVTLASASSLSVQQDSLYFPPADRVSVRVVSEVSPGDVAPGVHVRTIVGAVSSLSIGDLEPGSAAVLHHHTREQADFGLTGTFALTIGTHVEPLGPGDGVILPANVEHSIANHGTQMMTAIEFHTVRRPDLVPPRPPMTFPATAEPVGVPDGRQLTVKLDRVEATSVERTLRGKTCTMTWRSLARGTPPVDLRADSTELWVYLIRGSAELDVLGAKQSISAGAAVLIPAHQRVGLRAVSTDVALVEFSGAER
jgi:quercetin dioxygenase-like cupin family protein